MVTTSAKPEKTRTYHHTFINSENWDNFKPRDNDIIVATSYKGGTTWMQNICGTLVFQSPEPPAGLDEISPWIDAVFEPNAEVLARIEKQTHRRYLKTHLPLTAVPFFDQAKYIFVGRDGRDVFLSLANHLSNLNPELVQELASRADQKGPLLPPPAPDLEHLFSDWVGKGTYEWESDGYPVWSHHHHAQTWWDCRKLDNILHVHFQDLLDDLDGQMRRVSQFLDIPVNETVWPELVESLTFDEMKKNATKRAPGGERGMWKDTKNFFHKGKNKQWQGVLSAAQVDRYEEVIEQIMEPSLIEWMIHNDGFIDPKSV